MNLQTKLVGALFSLPCTAQVSNWVLQQPWSTTGGAMATDPATGRAMRFGGSSTTQGPCPDFWAWNGDRWARRASALSPGPRTGHAMVTDTVRGQIVLFGGESTVSRDTWTWDGLRWTAHATPLLLPMRAGHAMAFDAQRGRTVLFAGSLTAAYPLNDTWEWDGTSWILCQPGAPPAARFDHRMAFDAARGKVVLFGGRSSYTTPWNDTWEWDGTFWTPRIVAVRPNARYLHALAYDAARQRIVMFGGSTIADTWEWDGAAWTQRHPAHSPPTHTGHAMLYDAPRGKMVLFGAPGGQNDVWEYDGVDWQQVPVAAEPPPRSAAHLAHDAARGEMVLFGGASSSSAAGDTWTWNGDRWTARSPASSPSNRIGGGITFDAQHNTVCLFGGSTTSGYVFTPNDETWTWTGSDWIEAQPAHSPPARLFHGLQWHAGSQKVVLFGGRDGSNSNLFHDTWTWDGTDWTQLSPTTSPPGRFQPGFAREGQHVLLFGGGIYGQFSSTASLDDTWRFDGANWAALQPAVSPPARYGHTTAGDTTHGRVLMTGGIASNSTNIIFSDTWLWDGVTWSPFLTSTPTPARLNAAMAYDADHDTALLVGYSADTWTLAPVGAEALFGTGCPGSLGLPTLQTSPDSAPEPGGTLVFQLTNLPSTLALMAVGFSNTTAGTQALPLSLAPFGMPGCNLLVAPDTTVLLAVTAHEASWTLVVPHENALSGVEFFCQAFAFDPGANLAGLIATNAGRSRLGN